MHTAGMVFLALSGAAVLAVICWSILRENPIAEPPGSAGQELREPRFRRVPWGYDPAEVQSYVAAVRRLPTTVMTDDSIDTADEQEALAAAAVLWRLLDAD